MCLALGALTAGGGCAAQPGQDVGQGGEAGARVGEGGQGRRQQARRGEPVLQFWKKIGRRGIDQGCELPKKNKSYATKK